MIVIGFSLWALTGVISWLIVRAMLIYDDSGYRYARRWHGTFREEYCEVSIAGVLWLFFFAFIGPVSIVAAIVGVCVLLITVFERRDFSWLGKPAFSLCFWKRK